MLTGETGAGKSILLDALALLGGDRFELRQLRPGADRAELAAVFEVNDRPDVDAWLTEQGLSSPDASLLVRRTLDAHGRSRAWINGRPVTLAQLKEVADKLVDLYGQHAHQSLTAADAQRALVDAFGGFSALARATAAALRAWNAAVEKRDAAAQAAMSSAAEREMLDARKDELTAIAVSADEYRTLAQAQSRLAHAAALIEAAAGGEDTLSDGEQAIVGRLAALIAKLEGEARHDPALAEIVAQLEPARIQLDEAARALRGYRRKLDLDPAELARVEERLVAIHDVARKHRVPPEGLEDLRIETEARLAALALSTNAAMLAQQAVAAEGSYRRLAGELSAKREFAANDLEGRVTAAMQNLAMAGGRLEIALESLATPASFGVEQIEFRVATHPKQPLGPLAKVASGGELSRISLAIQVSLAQSGSRCMVFDEVDAGVGGAVAEIVGRELARLGAQAQVLCVTHLAQVAAQAAQQLKVSKLTDGRTTRTSVKALSVDERIAEIARMLGGVDITDRALEHAREMLGVRGAAQSPERTRRGQTSRRQRP